VAVFKPSPAVLWAAMSGMRNYICKTCGVQHAASEQPPEQCLICQDERQYVGWGGQQWTTLEEMRAGEYRNVFVEAEVGLTSIHTYPRFAIGQRALLAQTPAGNFLWDCQSFVDDETVEKVTALGGLHGVSVSHPHFYGVMIEWARTFAAPVYVPEADRQWVVRPDAAVQFYEGALEPLPGLTLVQCGGHFEGSAVLHGGAGAGGRGALLAGDTIAVMQDRRWLSFMRSYPNMIPLPEGAIRGIVEALRPYAFERIYGGWLGLDVREDGKAAVERSSERYVRWLGGETTDDR